jgi:hypothetical protein
VLKEFRAPTAEFVQRLGGLAGVELVDRLYEEVTQIPVETDRPPIEETLVAEQSKGKALVKYEVHIRFPTEIVKWWKDKIDCGRDGWPVLTHQGHSLVRIARIRRECHGEKIANSSWEYASR